ncbi:MAG: hypothetical protein H8E57_01460 [Candidatus Cloacimonetes bacterium]|nr:hypothetical protein [Candidatus Cloacimonadota bacterium]
MLKHFLKRFWKLLIVILSLLSELIAVQKNWKTIYIYYTTFLHNKAQSMNTSTEILLILIVLSVLCLINLTLSLLFIFNKSKQKPFAFDKSPKPKENLPPKKDMGKILLAISKVDTYIPFGKEKELNLSREKINSYFSILSGYDYIKCAGKFPSPTHGKIREFYRIQPKGSQFLLKHNFLK